MAPVPPLDRKHLLHAERACHILAFINQDQNHEAQPDASTSNRNNDDNPTTTATITRSKAAKLAQAQTQTQSQHQQQHQGTNNNGAKDPTNTTKLAQQCLEARKIVLVVDSGLAWTTSAVAAFTAYHHHTDVTGKIPATPTPDSWNINDLDGFNKWVNRYLKKWVADGPIVLPFSSSLKFESAAERGPESEAVQVGLSGVDNTGQVQTQAQTQTQEKQKQKQPEQSQVDDHAIASDSDADIGAHHDKVDTIMEKAQSKARQNTRSGGGTQVDHTINNKNNRSENLANGRVMRATVNKLLQLPQEGNEHQPQRQLRPREQNQPRQNHLPFTLPPSSERPETPARESNSHKEHFMVLPHIQSISRPKTPPRPAGSQQGNRGSTRTATTVDGQSIYIPAPNTSATPQLQHSMTLYSDLINPASTNTSTSSSALAHGQPVTKQAGIIIDRPQPLYRGYSASPSPRPSVGRTHEHGNAQSGREGEGEGGPSHHSHTSGQPHHHIYDPHRAPLAAVSATATVAEVWPIQTVLQPEINALLHEQQQQQYSRGHVQGSLVGLVQDHASPQGQLQQFDGYHDQDIPDGDRERLHAVWYWWWAAGHNVKARGRKRQG